MKMLSLRNGTPTDITLPFYETERLLPQLPLKDSMKGFEVSKSGSVLKNILLRMKVERKSLCFKRKWAFFPQKLRDFLIKLMLFFIIKPF